MHCLRRRREAGGREEGRASRCPTELKFFPHAQITELNFKTVTYLLPRLNSLAFSRCHTNPAGLLLQFWHQC